MALRPIAPERSLEKAGPRPGGRTPSSSPRCGATPLQMQRECSGAAESEMALGVPRFAVQQSDRQWARNRRRTPAPRELRLSERSRSALPIHDVKSGRALPTARKQRAKIISPTS